MLAAITWKTATVCWPWSRLNLCWYRWCGRTNIWTGNQEVRILILAFTLTQPSPSHGYKFFLWKTQNPYIYKMPSYVHSFIWYSPQPCELNHTLGYVLNCREATIQVVNWLFSLPSAKIKTKGQKDFSTPSFIFLYWINQWFGGIDWTNFLVFNIDTKPPEATCAYAHKTWL